MQPRILGSKSWVGERKDDRGGVISDQATVERREKPALVVQRVYRSENDTVDHK